MIQQYRRVTEYDKAAIIGFWRSGADYEQVQQITGVPTWYIEKLIAEYKNSLGLKTKNESQ